MLTAAAPRRSTPEPESQNPLGGVPTVSLTAGTHRGRAAVTARNRTPVDVAPEAGQRPRAAAAHCGLAHVDECEEMSRKTHY
jgi:hypothetical protein